MLSQTVDQEVPEEGRPTVRGGTPTGVPDRLRPRSLRGPWPF